MPEKEIRLFLGSNRDCFTLENAKRMRDSVQKSITELTQKLEVLEKEVIEPSCLLKQQTKVSAYPKNHLRIVVPLCEPYSHEHIHLEYSDCGHCYWSIIGLSPCLPLYRQ